MFTVDIVGAGICISLEFEIADLTYISQGWAAQILDWPLGIYLRMRTSQIHWKFFKTRTISPMLLQYISMYSKYILMSPF